MYKNIRINTAVSICLILMSIISVFVFPETPIFMRITLFLCILSLIYLLIQISQLEKLHDQNILDSDQLIKQEVINYNNIHRQANSSITNQFKSLKDTINQIAILHAVTDADFENI